MEKYDVIIIGGASAGLSAGLYTARRALKTLILTKDIGGQAAITTEIENYPGAGMVNGAVLMNKFREQAEQAGALIKMEAVSKVIKAGNTFMVITEGKEYEAVAVILAFGLEHNKLMIPGEAELIGRGVTYCATCDGPLYKNKIVAVVGGGNSALDAADYLADICQRVYLFVRGDKFRGDEESLLNAVQNSKKIEIRYKTELKEIIGEKKLEKVITASGEEVKIDGLFIETGYKPKTDFIKELVAVDDQGQIIVDGEAKTSVIGIFAAGDVTNSPFKQVVISAGDGAKAALSACRYIKDIKGGEDRPDWTRRKQSSL